ncbi:MAG: TVP38/TMEM64 family protein [Cytophagaceae bacterium]
MHWFKFLRTNLASFAYFFSMVLIPLTVSSTIIYQAIQHEDTISGFGVSEWAFFFALSSLTMAFAFTPTTFIALFCGYFLGFFSLPFLVISYMVAALIGFYAAEWIDKGKFLNSLQKIKGVENFVVNIRQREFWMVFFARLSPVFPFAIMNVFLAVINTRLQKFLLGSLLGMLPRTVISIYIGHQFASLVKLSDPSPQDLITRIALIALLLISSFGILRIFAKAMSKRV